MYSKKDDDKRFSYTLLAGEAVNFFVNRRSRSPTLLGWILIVIIGIMILNALYQRGSTPEDVNPKFQDKVLNDPQEVEFKMIEEENKKKGHLPVLPVFDPNKHRGIFNKERPGSNVIEAPRHPRPQPKNFPVKYIYQPNIDCNRDANLPLLILVQSRPDMVGARGAIRRTWGKWDRKKYPKLTEKKWMTIFIMGKSDTVYFDQAVAKESEEHGDLLLGDFKDTPYEDTRKFMMAMKWVNENLKACAPRFVLKTQDNIYHNMLAILGWLDAKFEKNEKQLYVGKKLRLDRPIRDNSDPLYVPESDYSKEFFPDMIQGPVYLFSFDAYLKMALYMSGVTPIAMEDAYVGVLAEYTGLKPRHNDHFQMLTITYNKCHHLKVFFIFKVMPSEHLEIFRRIKIIKQSPECKGAMLINKESRHDAIDV